MADLVLHIHRELIHHLSEVCLLRDLRLRTKPAHSSAPRADHGTSSPRDLDQCHGPAARTGASESALPRVRFVTRPVNMRKLGCCPENWAGTHTTG
ncbi:hypothetical protein FMEAI12_1710012 [Parafrankia sp. Ea1.12]|nr:hypothetical protein FMEAI12_1710012 [Parafrankia sp. Ea1.12]